MSCLSGPAPLRACLCWLFLSLAEVTRAHPVFWTRNRGNCQHPTLGYGGHYNPRHDDEITFKLVHRASQRPVQQWRPGEGDLELKVEHDLPMEYFVTTTVGKLWQYGTDYSSCNGAGWFAGGGKNTIHIMNITMPDCCEVKETEMIIYATGASGRADHYHQNVVSFTGNLDRCQCDEEVLAALPDPLPPKPEHATVPTDIPTPTALSGGSSGMASWAKAIVALAVVAVVGAIAVGVFLFVRKRRAQRQLHGMEMNGSYSKWGNAEHPTNGKPPNPLEEC